MPTVGTMTGPGTVTITDDTSAAVILQTQALVASLKLIQGAPGLPGSLYSIDANLFAIQKNLGRIADLQQSMSKAVSSVNIAVGSLATSQSSANVLQAAMVANQTQTNNFQYQVTVDALTRTGQPVPVMPPFAEQAQKIVEDAVSFNAIATAQGAATEFITQSAKDIATWVAQTKVYTTAAKWLEDAVDSLISQLPPSLKSTKIAGEAVAGVKNPTV